jgi:hypothetical protein
MRMPNKYESLLLRLLCYQYTMSRETRDSDILLLLESILFESSTVYDVRPDECRL